MLKPTKMGNVVCLRVMGGSRLRTFKPAWGLPEGQHPLLGFLSAVEDSGCQRTAIPGDLSHEVGLSSICGATPATLGLLTLLDCLKT